MTSFAGSIRSILEEHAELRRLCDELEVMADRLPAARAEELERVTSQLDDLAAHHERDRRALDRMFLASEFAGLWACLRSRLAAHHHEAENLRLDIMDALSCRDPIGSVRDANAAGYMLRCFFESYRRTMLIEELILFALARHRLEASDHDALLRSLQTSDGSSQSSFGPHL